MHLAGNRKETAHVTKSGKLLVNLIQNQGSCLKTGQHYVFVIIRKIKNNTRMLDTLFIDDFIDIMEQYFHY